MKTKFGYLMFFLVFAGILFVMFNTNAHAADIKYGTITADAVKLRAESNTESGVLAEMPFASNVEVLSYADNWYRVIYSKDSETLAGYVRSDLIYVAGGESRAAYALTDNVLVYGMASENSYVSAVLATGQSVKVKSIIGKWYFVTYGEMAGFVKISNVSVSRPGVSTLGRLLKQGMSGEEVTKLQQELYKRGFLSIVNITGYYGSVTQNAVAGFQSACRMPADGIAGDETIQTIYDKNNTVTSATAAYNRVKGTVELLDWFKGGSSWLGRGAYFTITDVKTGKSFQARRFGGWFHADSEPVTAADTAIMKQIAGGSWSWNRRAIWVTYNGRTVAASMHCMPHMGSPTASNNFDGHFCVHLLNSKVHETGRPCPRHQACVMQAYNAGKSAD